MLNTCAHSDVYLFVGAHLRMRAVRIINFRQLKGFARQQEGTPPPPPRRTRDACGRLRAGKLRWTFHLKTALRNWTDGREQTQLQGWAMRNRNGSMRCHFTAGWWHKLARKWELANLSCLQIEYCSMQSSDMLHYLSLWGQLTQQTDPGMSDCPMEESLYAHPFQITTWSRRDDQKWQSNLLDGALVLHNFPSTN